MKKSSIWYGIFKYKCPRCHEGDLFLKKPNYTTNFLKMHRNCPVCNQTYTPEPGFYFGAAYISYMISVAISVIMFGIFYFGLGWKQPTPLISAIIAAVVVLAPVNFRLSRSVWANIFIKYKPLSSS